MIDDLIELNRRLQEASAKPPHPSKFRMRTAASDEVNRYLRAGFYPTEISEELGHPMRDVLAEQARIEGYERRKQRYLPSLNMDMPGKLVHFTIYQR